MTTAADEGFAMLFCVSVCMLLCVCVCVCVCVKYANIVTPNRSHITLFANFSHAIPEVWYSYNPLYMIKYLRGGKLAFSQFLLNHECFLLTRLGIHYEAATTKVFHFYSNRESFPCKYFICMIL